MITLNDAILHAAEFDESLSITIQHLLKAANERNEPSKSFEEAEQKTSRFASQAEACVLMLDACLTASAKKLAEESEAKKALDNMMLDGVSFPSFGAKHA